MWKRPMIEDTEVHPETVTEHTLKRIADSLERIADSFEYYCDMTLGEDTWGTIKDEEVIF